MEKLSIRYLKRYMLSRDVRKTVETANSDESLSKFKKFVNKVIIYVFCYANIANHINYYKRAEKALSLHFTGEDDEMTPQEEARIRADVYDKMDAPKLITVNVLF